VKSKVVVTGGAGFIGSHIVDSLLASGSRVVIVDDFSTGNRGNLQFDADIVQLDIANPSTAEVIVGLAPDAIVHAAAQASVPRSMSDPGRDMAVNLQGTANLIEGAKRLPDCRFVFLSTGGGIYGDTVDAATEQTLPKPKSFYSTHKYTAERYLEYSGLNYAIARLANVYGSRQRSNLEGGVVAIFAERLRAGLPISIYGSGEQTRDFVHVFDVVRAIQLMLESERSGLWNVGTGQKTTIRGLLALMADLMQVEPDVHFAPGRAGDVFNSCLDSSAIARELGWKPIISLAEGVGMIEELNLITT